MFLLNAPEEAEVASKFASGFQTRANFCLPLNCALRLFSVEIVDPFSYLLPFSVALFVPFVP